MKLRMSFVIVALTLISCQRAPIYEARNQYQVAASQIFNRTIDRFNMVRAATAERAYRAFRGLDQFTGVTTNPYMGQQALAYGSGTGTVNQAPPPIDPNQVAMQCVQQYAAIAATAANYAQAMTAVAQCMSAQLVNGNYLMAWANQNGTSSTQDQWAFLNNPSMLGSYSPGSASSGVNTQLSQLLQGLQGNGAQPLASGGGIVSY